MADARLEAAMLRELTEAVTVVVDMMHGPPSASETDMDRHLKWNRMISANSALRAALSASPPAPGGVPIRIAVAMTPSGDWCARGRAGWDDEMAWASLPKGHPWQHAAIITATVEPPVVPEIAGSVQPAGG